MQDEDPNNEINIDREKAPVNDDKASNEARSAPNNPSGIASFIMPDSMADIFGEDYKPDEIKTRHELKMERKQFSAEKKKAPSVAETPDKPLDQSPIRKIKDSSAKVEFTPAETSSKKDDAAEPTS